MHLHAPSCRHKKSKMAGFYTARSRTIPPLPWPSFAPPFSDPAGKIVEHWDVLQVLSKESANENGMF